MDTFLYASAAWPLNFWSTDDSDLNRGTNLGRVGITRCNLHAQHPPAWSRLVVTPFLISLFFLSFFGSGPWIQSWSHLRTKPDTLKRKHENACNCLMAPSSSTPWDVPRLFTCSSCLSPLQGKVHHLSARVHQLQWNKQIGPRDILHQEGPAVKLVYIMQLCVCLYLLAFLLPFLSLSIRNIANNVNIQRYYYSHLKNDCGSTREKVLEVLHQPWQCYSRKTDSDVSASVIW